MKPFLCAFGCLFLMSSVEAGEVELADCRLTPEVKKELQLTPQQDPEVERIFSHLSSIREEVEESRRKRDELRRLGADEDKIEEETKHLITLENQCRERLHQELKLVLTEVQFQKVLEMEEVHRRRIRERSAPAQSEAR